MSDSTESRIAALEAAVRALQHTVSELQAALGVKGKDSKPELRSRGMLDRPRPGK